MDNHNQSTNQLLEVWARSVDLERQKLEEQLCEHEPVPYVGFTERYDYCSKCDAKYTDGAWKTRH